MADNNTMTEQRSLQSLTQQLSISHYITEIWKRRDFLLVVPRHDARAKHMTSPLGQVWHLLNPGLMTLVYYLIFGVILNADRGTNFYVSFLAIGILMFQLIQRCAMEGASLLQKHDGLIKTLQFPRAVLVLSSVIEQAYTFIPSILIMILVALAEGARLRVSMLLIPIALVATTLLSVGFTMFTARAGSIFPDLKNLLPHLFRILLYGSGVLFQFDQLISNVQIKAILGVNPIHLAISFGRWCILGSDMSVGEFAILLCWVVVAPLAGIAYFYRGESSYGQ